MGEKKELRSHLRGLSQKLCGDGQLWGQKQIQLQSHLIDCLKQKTQGRAEIWCMYRALPFEINLAEIPMQLAHIQWVYPRVDGEGLRFFAPGPKGFEIGYAKIEEPIVDQAEEVLLPQIHGFLIPGLGFDKRGGRLGQGKGFYDRMLEEYKGVKIGVTFKDFVLKEVPMEKHDVLMDVVVTDEGIIKWM